MSTYREIRSAIGPAAKTLLFRSGVCAAVRRARPSRQFGILRYHAICGPEGHAYASPSICVSPAAFERQVRYLASHYRVLSLPEAVDALRGGRSLPPNAVALTFDDGYADNLEAARILHRHGVSGTFYLTAGCLNGGEPFWPSEVRYLVAALKEPRVTLRAEGETVELLADSPSDREQSVRRLNRLFKSKSIPVREQFRAALRGAAAHPAIPRIMLTWEEVREMKSLGMTIGSHTMTHPNLPSAGIEAAAGELRAAKDRLEAETGAPVTMFSYPNGGAERYFTPELQRIVRESGYHAATTSRNGFAGPDSDLFALQRIQVAERLQDLVFALDVERFAFKPSGALRGFSEVAE